MDMIGRLLSRVLPDKTWKKLLFQRKIRQLRKTELGSYLRLNKQLKDIHRGERCFILGNGPSLSSVDLSLLSNEITFTVNELFYKADFDQLQTTYHLFADPFYISKLSELIPMLCRKSKPSGIFIESSGYQNILQLDASSPPIYLYANGIEVETLNVTGLDLCKLLPYFCTVVQSAIMIAVYMGISEIYLLGCDCTGILNYIDKVHGKELEHYAYQVPREEQEKQQEILLSCEHMFFEWYHIFKSYRIIRRFLEGKNVTLINLTEDGILDSLEKGNLKDVIESK